MTKIKELFELARQSYAVANATLNPETKKTLQDIGAKYVQQADELHRNEITQAVFPSDKN
jgi:hypothetical protein